MKPIWDKVELPNVPALARNITVDVAVIGGGLTGITAAYLLRQAGVSVALLERRTIGGVDTGCTTAHLTPVVDTDLTSLAHAFGRDHAQAVWDAGFAAIEQIAAAAAERGIDCELAWVPGFKHAPVDADAKTVESDRDRLEVEAELALDLGFDVTFLERTPLVNQPGWRIENQAVFHPRKYLRGLLDALAQDKVVFQESPVEFTDDPNVLQCGPHTVRARHVFMATHNPLTGHQTLAQASLLQTNLALYTSYVVGGHAAESGLEPGCYWDTSDPYRYVRIDRDEDGVRVIAGGEDHKTGQEPDTAARFTALERWALALVPTLKISHQWSGQVIETPDGLPFIGEVAPRQYVATGFAGNGMTFGTLSAMIVRDIVTGAKNPWAGLFDVSRSAIANGPLDYLKENADYPYYMIRDRFAGAERKDFRGIARGTGRLVESNGSVVAAYRDKSGRLIVHSATCTHLGCRVGWNAAEGTWDCPCHGSRFTETGEVLAGPAEKPLEAVDIASTASARSHPR